MSNPVPSSLALTTPADGATLIASRDRNNDTAIQTAVNAIITALSGGVAGQVLQAASGSAVQWSGVATSQSNVSAPAGTTSTASFKQLGLAASFTPTATGVVVVALDGTCSNSVAGDGGTYQFSYGTGAAPANGAAAAGTVVGAAPRAVFAGANDPDPFSITRIVTGLSVGTAYWLDLQFQAITGGTFSFGQVNVAAYELH